GIDYDFVGAVTDTSAATDLPLLGDYEDLPRLLERLHPDELIVSGVDLADDEFLDLVEEAHRHGVKVRLAPATTELLTQRAEYVPGQGGPLFELRPPVVAGFDWAVERAFDVVAGALLLIVLSPLSLVLPLAL